jgi:hypothetical protein
VFPNLSPTKPLQLKFTENTEQRSKFNHTSKRRNREIQGGIFHGIIGVVFSTGKCGEDVRKRNRKERRKERHRDRQTDR